MTGTLRSKIAEKREKSGKYVWSFGLAEIGGLRATLSDCAEQIGPDRVLTSPANQVHWRASKGWVLCAACP